MRIEKFENMSLYVLTEEQLQNNQFSHGYKYLVSRGSYNYEALRTLEGLKYWLNLHLLSIPENIQEGNRYQIEGVFFEICLFRIEPTMPGFSNFHNEYNWDQPLFDLFGRKNNLTPSFIMNNGSWTRSYVYRGSCGLSEIGLYDNVSVTYYLNPNCKQNKYNFRQFNDGIPNNPEVMEN